MTQNSLLYIVWNMWLQENDHCFILFITNWYTSHRFWLHLRNHSFCLKWRTYQIIPWKYILFTHMFRIFNISSSYFVWLCWRKHEIVNPPERVWKIVHGLEKYLLCSMHQKNGKRNFATYIFSSCIEFKTYKRFKPRALNLISKIEFLHNCLIMRCDAKVSCDEFWTFAG